MSGYWRDPDATSLALRDGWLHTGDIGVLDGDGYLQITDRKKDIIVLSGGDNVAPARIESFLLLQPEIAQAMVVGDKRPHLVALLVPDPEFARQWARENKIDGDIDAVVAQSRFHRPMATAVDRVNGCCRIREDSPLRLDGGVLHHRERDADTIDENPPPQDP